MRDIGAAGMASSQPGSVVTLPIDRTERGGRVDPIVRSSWPICGWFGTGIAILAEAPSCSDPEHPAGWQATPLAGHSPLYVEPTVQCTECAVIRGVVKAVRLDDQAKNGDDSTDIERLQPDYQRLTDEQWSWIKHIVHTEDGPRRGRPRTDVRTIVDAALYKTRTGITWRELPAEFGSWQTASRQHRELIASSQWDEITRTLTERDLP